MSIEQVQAYWDKQPCNVLHSSKPVGSRVYFDQVRQRRYFVHPHVPRFARFGEWKGRKVLEIGCGIGADAVCFAEAGAKVTAVDLSERSLELAKRHAEAYGLAIEFHCGDAERLTDFLPTRAYDLIYSCGVLHHTPRPERIVGELTNYARPGTTLKVMLYHRHSWKALLIFLGMAQSEAQAGVPIARTYTRRQARRLVRPFEIKEIFVDHIFPYRVPDYRAHRYRKKWHFRHIPNPLFRWLERYFGWHLCISAEMPNKCGEGTL